MSEIDALVARSAELKGELLAYGRGKRFDRAFDRAFDDTDCPSRTCGATSLTRRSLG